MSKNQNNDIDFEIGFYESILKESPNFIQAMMALADLYTKKGLYREGLNIDESLARLRPDDPVVFYNLACSYSLLNNPSAALKAAKTAVELGYDDFEHLHNDPDLANLLVDPQFQQYLKDVEKKRRIADKTVKHKEEQ